MRKRDRFIIVLGLASVLWGLLGLITSGAQVKPGSKMKATVKRRLTGGHTVTLSGCTSTTAGVTFNVYRGTTSQGESATPLNSAPLANCSYTDTTVAAATTYFYYVKAFCATCAIPLSNPSNEVTAVIPQDPQPAAPIGLSAGAIAKNQVPLLWAPPAAQTGYDVLAYQLYRGTTPTLPSPTRVAILPGWTHSYTDKGCGASKSTCFYAVRTYALQANNAFVASVPSNILKVTMP